MLVPPSLLQHDKMDSSQDGTQTLIAWPLPYFWCTYQPLLSCMHLRYSITTSRRPLCWQFLFYSSDIAQEELFKTLLQEQIQVDFKVNVDYFLCTVYTWLQHADVNISVHLCQSAFTEFTDHLFSFHTANKVPNMTPYCYGSPIGSIPPIDSLDPYLQRRKQFYQIIVGCIHWFATCTRPAIAPVLKFLA